MKSFLIENLKPFAVAFGNFYPFLTSSCHHLPPDQVKEALEEVEDPEDAHVFASAKASHCHILLIYNPRHFRHVKDLLVMRPYELLIAIKEWLWHGFVEAGREQLG